MRMHPFYKILTAHQGVDYTVSEGSRVFATADGRVKDVLTKNTTSGRTVIIDHGNGYETTYSHLGKIYAKRGERVKRGDIIAQSDNNDTITLTEIPAKQSTVDDVKSNMLVSSSREEMNAEILTMKQKSEDVLKSVEYHKNFLSACQQMLSALNPEFAAKQQQEQKISQLESQIAEMAKGMNELMKFNKMLAEQLGVNPETNKKK